MLILINKNIINKDNKYFLKLTSKTKIKKQQQYFALSVKMV